MLTGEYNHSIDSKGRLIIPAKFREILGDSFVITKGLDNCLFVYPDNEWKTFFEEKAQNLTAYKQERKNFYALFSLGVQWKAYLTNRKSFNLFSPERFCRS